jgi:hypothetical protein
MANEAEQKAAAEKAAADKAAADVKAQADADAKAKAKAGAGDDGGDDLAKVFEEGDKGKGKADDKGGLALSLKVPDDLKDYLGDDSAQVYAKKAQDLGLDQKQLQGLADLNFEMTRQRQAALEQENKREADEVTLAWKRELMTDPQIGGAKLKESIAVAQRGARALGGTALAVKLAQHLRGEEIIDGPTLIRAFHMAGLAQGEDRLGGTGEAKPKDEDAALSPSERDFKRMHPETWKRMQAEKTGRA